MNRVYPWQIIGGVTADGLSFCTWRRGIVSSGEDPLDARAKVSEPQDEFPHVCGLDNFRRGDTKVRTYILASILAHRDASVDAVRETAVLDFGRQGCHEQDIEYFNDYLEHGRHLGRGHLFVGTLPTTPPCEAAISLKLTGPGIYMDALDRFPVLWDEVSTFFEMPWIRRVMVFRFESGKLTVLLIERGGTTGIPDGTGPEELLRQTFQGQ